MGTYSTPPLNAINAITAISEIVGFQSNLSTGELLVHITKLRNPNMYRFNMRHWDTTIKMSVTLPCNDFLDIKEGKRVQRPSSLVITAIKQAVRVAKIDSVLTEH
jgi:hypothetical protein